jgi:hypothetical protein
VFGAENRASGLTIWLKEAPPGWLLTASSIATSTNVGIYLAIILGTLLNIMRKNEHFIAQELNSFAPIKHVQSVS